jgi:hypothetical protein
MLGLDELIEHWTVLDDERKLIAGKRGPTRLGFAVLLKFFTQHGRFPLGLSEFLDEAIDFVARQVKVPAPDIGFYEWSGSTIEYHRSQIRDHLGFRECSVTAHHGVASGDGGRAATGSLNLADFGRPPRNRRNSRRQAAHRKTARAAHAERERPDNLPCRAPLAASRGPAKAGSAPAS